MRVSGSRTRPLNQIRTLLPAVAAALGALSCATTPMARASDAERLQCDATTIDATTLVERLSVLAVSPLYVQIHSSTVGEVRVRGAKLLVHPPDGVDPYRLVRSLQCHAARILLGRARPIDPNDPFSLPGSWLQIDIQSESGNYLVSILADSVSEGVDVLARARAFARDHGLSVDALPASGRG